MSDQPLTPPAVEYEDIILRELSFGFPGGGTQDITLYPEDALDISGDNIFITFHSMEEKGIPNTPTWRAKVAPGMWISDRYTRHRRVKGTLRPTPEEVSARFRQTQERESKARLQSRIEQLAREGFVGSDYDPNA